MPEQVEQDHLRPPLALQRSAFTMARSTASVASGVGMMSSVRTNSTPASKQAVWWQAVASISFNSFRCDSHPGHVLTDKHHGLVDDLLSAKLPGQPAREEAHRAVLRLRQAHRPHAPADGAETGQGRPALHDVASRMAQVGARSSAVLQRTVGSRHFVVAPRDQPIEPAVRRFADEKVGSKAIAPTMHSIAPGPALV